MIHLRSRIFFASAATLLVFSACSSNKDFKEPAEADHRHYDISRTFQSSLDRTFTAAAEALKKYPIMASRKEGGYIITDWITGKSDILYSGYGDTRIPYTIRYRFTVNITGGKEGSTVTIRTKEQYLSDAVTAGVDFSGSLYQWLDTKSSTHKEHRLLEQIAQLLGENKG